MVTPELQEATSQGVTLLTDPQRPCGVTLAFTERDGGVSQPPYASLNLGSNCGDDLAAVTENRLRALVAVGAEAYASNLVIPLQVHGSHVVTVGSNDPDSVAAAQAEALAGADAVVCTCGNVPVMLCFADCVPVIIVSDGGFSVIHSGWKGTIAHISGLALDELLSRTGDDARDVNVYIGPHIAGRDYEVSSDLMGRFESEFGSIVNVGENRLSLAHAIRHTLVSRGVTPWRIVDAGLSTPRNVERFFSYRQENGVCGRHGAVAWRPSRS